MNLNHFGERLVTTAEETAGGAFHLFLGGSASTVLSSVCAIIVARLLGPEQYGTYSLALIVSSFLTLFTDYGVSQALTRLIALHRSRDEMCRVIPLLRAGLVFSLATCLTIFFIGFIFTDPLTNLLINRSDMTGLVRITLFLLLFYPISAIAGGALLGFGDMKAYAIIDVVRQIFRLFLSPLLIVLGLGITGAVAGYVIAFSAGLALSLAFIYKNYTQIKSSNPKEGSGKALLPMITYGLPLYLSNTLNSFVITLRGIILAHYTTNALIGNFQIAMNFAVLITLVSSPVGTALFPAFSKLGSNCSEARTMFKYSVKYSSVLIIPAAVFVSVMSRDLIFLLYGASYTKAPLYLTIYTLTFLFAALGYTVLGSFFSGVGDPRVNLKATLLYVGIFTPSAITLTGILQVEGLLIAIIIATAASTLYNLTVAMRKYHLSIDLKSSACTCLAALSAAAPIIPLALYSPLPIIGNLALAALLYIAVYLTLAPLLKVITKEDLETLTRIFSKVTLLRPIVYIFSSYERKIIGLMKK
ncbi:MAG: oligosaccharide flippase family protein [Candidatus Bathyarchaeia archaeon]